MIFICGHHNSGKTTAAKYLKKFGFIHIETGNVVRQKHKELAPDVDFHQWAIRENHKFDKYIVDEILSAREKLIKSNGSLQDIVITGNRQIEGINYILLRIPPIEGKKNLIIFLHVSDEILFQRQILKPNRQATDLTFEEFKDELLRFDLQMGIEKIKEKTNCVIYNEGPLESFETEIRETLIKYGYKLPLLSLEGIISPNPERIV